MGSRVVQNVWVPSVFAAGTIACAQGLQMWLDLGVMAVEVESDALSVIRKNYKRMRMINWRSVLSLETIFG